MSNDAKRESIHFVTGKLAQVAVRDIVASLSSEHNFEYTIDVLPITVAALMTPDWLLKHMCIPEQSTKIILPGYLGRGLESIQERVHIPVTCGPKDIRDLPTMFGRKRHRGTDFGSYSIEIIAEINHAPRWKTSDLIAEAKRLVSEGADRIDLGCDPGSRWSDLAHVVKRLLDEGIALSIDTFDPWEATKACDAGVDLVLSVNKSNREAAVDWNAEVVVVPDSNESFLQSLSDTASFLSDNHIEYRLDAILEPIGCGFSNSLGRYLEVRKEFCDAKIMMGIGNVTELTDCDSAAMNTLLLGFCEEQKIQSVLTTQVIPWAKSSVRECHAARQLVNYAVRHKIPPKHIDDKLVILRDPTDNPYSGIVIESLVKNVKDNNYRVIVDDHEIHLISRGVHLRGTDPFELIDELMKLPESKNVDASHAFYLGFELSKALTALTLGKRYEQDEALRWGMFTRPEIHRRLSRTRSKLSDSDLSS